MIHGFGESDQVGTNVKEYKGRLFLSRSKVEDTQAYDSDHPIALGCSGRNPLGCRVGRLSLLSGQEPILRQDRRHHLRDPISFLTNIPHLATLHLAAQTDHVTRQPIVETVQVDH